MNTPDLAHDSSETQLGGEALVPARFQRPQACIEEMRHEAERRRTLMARRVMTEVARQPYFHARSRSAHETAQELQFWLALIEAEPGPPDEASTHAGASRATRIDRRATQAAVCRVADQLQPLDRHSTLGLAETRALRARAAAWAVLHRWRIEAARLHYLLQLEHAVDRAALERAIELPRHDWIGEAARALRRPADNPPAPHPPAA